MENTGVQQKTGKRKWVITAAAGFLVIIFLLTFFSNTVMNYSLPKVSAQYPSYGTISTSNRASGLIEATRKEPVKAFDNRVVEAVFVYEYNEVMAGDVLLTLKPQTESDELTSYKTQLEQIELERYYESLLPVNPPDYTYLEDAIDMASDNLKTANTDLSNAQNKETIIANAQTTITQSGAAIVQLTAEIDALSSVIAQLRLDLSEMEYERDQEILVLEQNCAAAVAALEDDRDDELEILYQELAVAQAALDAVPDGDDNSAELAEVNRIQNEIISVTDQYEADIHAVNSACQTGIDAVNAYYDPGIDQLNSDIAELEGQLSEKSTQLVTEQDKLERAQQKLAEAEMYLTVADAEKAVTRAQKALADAKKALSDQKKIDAVEAERKKRARQEEDKLIQDLKDKIKVLEDNMKITEIRAPISGMTTGFSVSPGEEIMKDQVLGIIIDRSGGYSADFVFSAQQARMIYIGMEMSVSFNAADRVFVTRIRPDPNDPRNSRIVSTIVEGEYLWEGNSIEVRFDDYSQAFECLVPNSSIMEDGTGKFVYVLDEKKGPLGEKYTALKVNVEVLATDGKMSALDPSVIQYRRIITRSEKPIANGVQVRLEYFQQEG
ncbi:MAG: hypothetical protein GXY43_03445 [Clostridiaceae bacterium]|nr:hypothetical protein [Clostridiaceae bacterium]